MYYGEPALQNELFFPEDNDGYGFAFVPFVLYGLAFGTAANLAITEVGYRMADWELGKHTGGTITLPSGEVVSADEAHEQLCAAVGLDHHWKKPDKNGQTFCDLSPSDLAAYDADLPSSFMDFVKDGFFGYKYRKLASGDCDAKNEDGSYVDYRCNGLEDPDKKSIPPWMIFAGAGIIVAAIVLSPGGDSDGG